MRTELNHPYRTLAVLFAAFTWGGATQGERDGLQTVLGYIGLHVFMF